MGTTVRTTMTDIETKVGSEIVTGEKRITTEIKEIGIFHLAYEIQN